ncbi:MAG: AmmeMemoRadiSam system protein B [Desulfuromonas sp.]|nr:MAG: AmmeMemoRadiSam system protein B [Desulfuromonas sp.]
MPVASIREPAVAGQFYPGEAEGLKEVLKGMFPTGIVPRTAIAVMLPHAGYIYSGAIAAETLARVVIPKRVILLGPNHHGIGEPASVVTQQGWRTPLGVVRIDQDLSQRILAQSDLISQSDSAHRHEHSLEVQVPLLQYLQPDLQITPLSLMHLSLDRLLSLGAAIAAVISETPEPVLLVTSTDMTHFESADAARVKDQLALAEVLALDPENLYRTVRDNRISMCGMIATVVVLETCRRLGASQVELVRYGNSGEVNGDMSEVVGYAGAVVPVT